MTNSPLKQWIEMGLSVPDYALKAPSWVDTTTFDLNAKLPNTPMDQKSQAVMMKALLIERFGMQWHEETGIVSGYELVTDKKVLMQPATPLERLVGHGGAGWGPTGVSGKNMSMSDLAEKLGQALGRPVVDATHLTGGYDLKVQWRPESDTTAADQNLPDSAFTAVREQLGLRLQPAKVPSRVIVIDHINSQPTAN